jgi:hypothetical protein
MQDALLWQYASTHGLNVVRTHLDAECSGETAHGRRGVPQLLDDVARGEHDFETLLVYDL